jgi:pimeloyl-ACP methyl ester carboxylesterase
MRWREPRSDRGSQMLDQSLRDYQDMLFAYPVPTLACTGAKSAQPRAGMEMIVERVPGARLEVFENCGHCLFLEDAEAFNRSVDRFARSLP